MVVKTPSVLLGIDLTSGFLYAAQPNALESLRPPSDEMLLFQAHGDGDQIYTCNATDSGGSEWKLKAPDARLVGPNGTTGRHFAGPTWEGADGSRVMGKVAASAPSPVSDSIPWLLLSATGHQGSGIMTGVLSIQRLDTKGGKAPTTGCDTSHIGAEIRVPYRAEYYFYGKR